MAAAGWRWCGAQARSIPIDEARRMCHDAEPRTAQAGVFVLTSHLMKDLELLRRLADNTEPGSELHRNVIAALARLQEATKR